ncbi:MAG: ABC transporter ATP-binding protein [Anaerolineae bacterium]|nr:ABC transporter ATP-binding protein [Anaerolineae bacterium]
MKRDRLTRRVYSRKEKLSRVKHNSCEQNEEKPLIRLCHVTRTFQLGARSFDAVRDVSLSIERGELLVIVGPSGSGKTTLLNLISGIDKPTKGEIWIEGTRIDQLDEDTLAHWRGQHVGIVFQFFQLLPTLTVLENVLLPLQLQDVWHNPSSERALALLEQVGMSAHLDKLPAELSGGEQQRVALARALINDPPILIADEPTGNLDSAAGKQVIELFCKQHQAGKTVILVTHEERVAEIASRRLRMVDGRLEDEQLWGKR